MTTMSEKANDIADVLHNDPTIRDLHSFGKTRFSEPRSIGELEAGQKVLRWDAEHDTPHTSTPPYQLFDKIPPANSRDTLNVEYTVIQGETLEKIESIISG